MEVECDFIGYCWFIFISYIVNIYGDLFFGKLYCVLRMLLFILVYVNKFMNINVIYIDFWFLF